MITIQMMVDVSYIVNSVFSSRTYILSKGNELWLVDCGDIEPLVNLFVGRNCKLKGVLLTHVHYDHFYGLPKLLELFPRISVYTGGAGIDELANERVNLSRYHEDPISLVYDNLIVCEEGDTIGLFDDVTVTIYETPGHSPSCLTYEVGNYLFTGDAYIPGIPVVTSLPGADKKLAKSTEIRIKQLSVGKIVCPGHELHKDCIVSSIVTLKQ